MNTAGLIQERIGKNAASIQKDKINQVLILYEEGIHYIGDACVRFDKIRYFRSFLNNGMITINFNKKHSAKIYNALLKNNPHVHTFFSEEWNDIDFTAYDVICCVTYDEVAILQYVTERYGAAILNGSFHPVIYSLSDFMLEPEVHSRFVFPVYKELVDYCRNSRMGELYVSQEEREEADQWLRAQGLKEAEYLVVMLDSTSDRNKLMKINAYFEFLSALLTIDNIRILIFDENNIGKEEFYGEWLGPTSMKKLIVSKSRGLREDICLVASPYTKLVFGPCTGLIHCASSVFNNYLNRGMARKDVPVLITYTGKYANNTNASFWWADAPLVHCLLLKERNNRKELLLLSDLTEEEQQRNDSLPCSEYSASLLLDFVYAKIHSPSQPAVS